MKRFYIALLSGILLMGCQPSLQETSQSLEMSSTVVDKVIEKQDFILDTVVSIKLYGFEDETVIDRAFDLCREYEDILSSHKEGSQIDLLNKKEKVELSDIALECIQEGIRYGALSWDRFDISVFPVSSLWDFTSGENVVPSQESITEGVEHVDYKKIHVENREVYFDDPEMAIDLGGIAKGYIADKLKEFLIQEGVESGIINLGGNNLCIGEKPSGEAFKIGIQRPFSERNEVMAIIDIKDESVVTSGIYERSFEVDGVLYHHILDPKTGYPVNNDLESVTIISPKSVDGDGLSTSCFLLGVEGGKKLVESQPGCYAIFITKDNEIIYSEGLLDRYKIEVE